MSASRMRHVAWRREADIIGVQGRWPLL